MIKSRFPYHAHTALQVSFEPAVRYGPKNQRLFMFHYLFNPHYSDSFRKGLSWEAVPKYSCQLNLSERKCLQHHYLGRNTNPSPQAAIYNLSHSIINHRPAWEHHSYTHRTHPSIISPRTLPTKVSRRQAVSGEAKTVAVQLDAYDIT